MLFQIPAFSKSILGFFRGIPSIFRKKNSPIKECQVLRPQNAESFYGYKDGIEVGRENFKRQLSEIKEGICTDFAHALCWFLAHPGEVDVFERVVAQMASIKQNALRNMDPFLPYKEAEEMFQTMEAIAQIDGLHQKMSGTKGKKRKAKIQAEIDRLTEDVRKCPLLYVYGRLAAYDSFSVNRHFMHLFGGLEAYEELLMACDREWDNAREADGEWVPSEKAPPLDEEAEAAISGEGDRPLDEALCLA